MKLRILKKKCKKNHEFYKFEGDLMETALPFYLLKEEDFNKQLRRNLLKIEGLSFNPTYCK